MFCQRKKRYNQPKRNQQLCKYKSKQQTILNNEMIWHLHVILLLGIGILQFNIIEGNSSEENSWTYDTMNEALKPPGVMQPNIVELMIGGNATITCRLSDANSSQIWFYENRTGRNITQPSPLIKVSDNYTAILLITNAAEQNSEYLCKVGSQAIGITKVTVGTPPQNITDFKCIVYGYEFMECQFSKPKNMLFTAYQLYYHFINETKEENCPLNPLNNGFSCNITQDYLPTRDEYIFKLFARNNAGENIQEFLIHNHKIVIPSQLIVNITNVTSNGVWLEWYNKDYSVTDGSYRKNLKYLIQLYENQTHLIHSRNITLDSKKFTLIDDLYAYWPYVVTIQAKSKEVDSIESDNDMEMWSKPSIKEFRTMARKPDRAPEVPEGSFYLDNTETQLRLYWKELNRFEHNGPGFHYIIRELNTDNQTIMENKTNITTIMYSWDSSQYMPRTFKISSANDEGESINYHIIRIQPNNPNISNKNAYILDEKAIAKVYHNNLYTLSWMPPVHVNQMLNYTVFWCLPKIELPNQCKGSIYYKYVDKNARNFTTEPQEADRSLNLAISANYPNFTKGMQWAQCSGDAATELMKMEIDVMALNESSILIKWNTGSVCVSILKGYNLSYWLPDDDNENQTRTYHTIQLLREQRNYTITNLLPHTEICVHMSMYSTTKRGRNSDAKCLKTKDGAPTAPGNLILVNVTSKSADISWEAPLITNGILTNYTIYWRKTAMDDFDKISIDVNQTSYTLTSLNSYTRYEIYVTAHTNNKESEPSNHINVSTLIGIPSNPRNVTITGDENESTITWELPLLPSGRLEFYVVALVRHYNDGEEITESVSLVKGRRCHFRTLECDNNYYSYKFKVRAVNVAAQKEYDHDIAPLTRNLTIGNGHIDQNFCRPHKNDVKLKFPYNLLLWRNAATNQEFALQQIQRQKQQSSQQAIFASPWSYSFQEYKCLGTNLFTYMTAIIMLGFIMVALISYWLRSKYREMKNIEVILPDGLIDQVSKYKFAQNNLQQQQQQQQQLQQQQLHQLQHQFQHQHQAINLNDDYDIETKKSSQLDMSCNSKDCLLNFDCNKINKILTTPVQTSPMDIKYHQNHIPNVYDQSPKVHGKHRKIDKEEENETDFSGDFEDHEHSSLATTNDELSSNSSSQNQNYPFYNNGQQYNALGENDQKIENDQKMREQVNKLNEGNLYNVDSINHKIDCQQVPFNNSDGGEGGDSVGGGYVTPNDLLLASTNLNSVDQTLSNLNLTNGYVQASVVKHLTPSFNCNPLKMDATDDYTRPEDLDKMLQQKIGVGNVPSHKLINSQQITTKNLHINDAGSPLNYENNSITTTTTSTTSATTAAIDVTAAASKAASFSENYKNLHSNNINNSFSHNNNNNSNNINNNNENNDNRHQTICGYVTQKQLANYGTNRGIEALVNNEVQT